VTGASRPRGDRELGFGEDELNRWRDITRKMLVAVHADGVLTQFEGYEELLELDWEGYRPSMATSSGSTGAGGRGRHQP
jgi:trehalose/maltose hydrolase-like predicted phosphorylase